MKINKDVSNGKISGLKPLCARINFLSGITYDQIKKKLDENNYLRNGVNELFEILNEREYITILVSGNILPILKYYQELLKIDMIFGSEPNMNKDTIINITESNFKGLDFKYEACLKALDKFKNCKKKIYGIGDSAVDIKFLSLADVKFAIDPKGGIEYHVDHVIKEIGDYLE